MRGLIRLRSRTPSSAANDSLDSDRLNVMPGDRGCSPLYASGTCSTLRARADVAQLVEHFTRNEGVRGSSPRVGSL